jgi:hypothetical protein
MMPSGPRPSTRFFVKVCERCGVRFRYTLKRKQRDLNERRRFCGLNCYTANMRENGRPEIVHSDPAFDRQCEWCKKILGPKSGSYFGVFAQLNVVWLGRRRGCSGRTIHVGVRPRGTESK